MPIGDDPQYQESVTVAGFFLKTWAYRSGVKAEGVPNWQLAPLLIGRDLVWHRPDNTQPSRWPSLAGGIAFLVLLIFVAWLLWRSDRRDRELESKAERNRFPPPDFDKLKSP